MKKMMNSLFVILGFISIGLGVIGICLPILPTTPFLLLGATLFAKGSTRFHKWFVATKLYNKYITKAVHSKEMTRKEKVSTLCFISCLMLIGYVISPIWHAKVVILAVVIGHFYYFLFCVKTVAELPKRKSEMESL